MAHLTRLGAVAALFGAVAFGPTQSQAQPTSITRTNLVSNLAGKAPTEDPNLKNPWGIANVPGGALWVSDNNSGVSTLYSGIGAIIPLVVRIIPNLGQTTGTPTGIVWNPTQGFRVTESGTSVPAAFIFATEDGTIQAWAPVNGTAPTTTSIVVPNTSATAVYKGLAFGTNTAGSFIFATNFFSGTIEAYDTNFKLATLKGAFTDPTIPAGFAPFGIQNIDGDLFVTYAKQDAAKHDDVPGAGLGRVDVFSTEGVLLKRFAAGGPLNAPWAVVRAPYGFGKFAGQILIGNFGDGLINAFPVAGRYATGALEDQRGKPIAIHGLWGLVNGSGAATDPDALYFTAGPNRETNGYFGSLTAKVATRMADLPSN